MSDDSPADGAQETEHGDREGSAGWRFLEAREVGEDRKIQIPNEIQETLQKETIKGPHVYWNLEVNSNWVVLSRDPVDEDSYVHGDYSKVIKPDQDWSRIRSPGAFDERILSKFFAGNQMFYLARHEDVERDNPRVFLLEQVEVMDVLPSNSDNDADTKDLLLNNPGFLSSI